VVIDNTLNRQFDVAAPDNAWVTDIRCIKTMEGFAYLAVVTDLFSRRVIGWSLQSRQTSEVVLRALHMAVWCRKPQNTVLVHSDQGSRGVFNRSSQHLNHGGVYGTTGGVDAEVEGARSIALARCAVASV
jgi:transposase InsO family protein